MDVHQVPVIDIKALMVLPSDIEVDAALSDAKDRALQIIIESIKAAATEWGFFYIANHGLVEHEIQSFQTAMRSFFSLPKEVKNTIRRSSSNSRGYFDDELTKNKKDWKECLDFAGRSEDGPASAKNERLGDDQNRWLEDNQLPGFHREMVDYFTKMESISRRLLKVVAVGLGEAPAFFDQFFHKDHSSFLRLNHYPVAPEPENCMGVYRHTDAGALTVLLQDDRVASLQVYHRSSHTWTLVSPRKGTLTINIGDMLQIWSNDQFLAPLHRVLASRKVERFSAPFFYNPSYKAKVQPIVVKEDQEAHYRPVSWREFRWARFQGDYADSGKEIQISDFKFYGPIDTANM